MLVEAGRMRRVDLVKLALVVDKNLNFSLLHHTDAAVCGSQILEVESVSRGREVGGAPRRGTQERSRQSKRGARSLTIPMTVPYS